jgi:hypothetical protein
VLVYRIKEFEKDGIPSDILEITTTQSPNNLYLEKGVYYIVIKKKEAKLVKKYTI